MKKLLLLLIALFLAISAYAECTFFVDQTEFEITENNIENGDEIFIPIHANFSARVSAWELTITYPEGMTAIFLEGGPDFSIEYTNARGRTANLTPPLYYDETYTSILSANASEGYYLVDGNWVSYGAVKWEAGGYDDFLDLYVVCDENFHGGNLVMTLRPASTSDARGGTIAENGDAGQSFITTTTLADPNNTAPAVQHDVNGDGEVNIADLNAIINAILTGDNINSNMDVNGDAEINIADCNAMINIILYRIDDNPHVVGQPTEDHLFVRNTYGAETVDNVVNFKDNETQLVWVWLDDDMIYMNEAVQYLDPMAYNSSGSLYNEITYNSLQCDIYLPQGFAIVNGVNEYGDNAQFAYGDRMPTTSYLTWSKKSNTKIIDGIEYDVYTLIIYNYNSYGSHFSAKNAKSYQNNGCLKKDAAPLFGIYLTHAIGEKAFGSELGDMLIANQEFYIGEAYSAGWPPNEYRFFYGTGGNNVSQRIQSYNRVKLVDGDVPAEDTNYYIVGNAPFGDWNINEGAQMTKNSDGTYSYTATIDGTTWFVFSDGLTEDPNDWETFNHEYRFGPSNYVDETIEPNTWYTTQKQGNGMGAYKFTGSGSEYTFIFDPKNMEFIVEGEVTPIETDTYTVAGSPSRVFSTEWDPSNTDNDMTLQDDATYMLQKYDCLLYANEKLQFKVVSNHSWEYAWPSDNYVVDVWATGIYDIIIWFNAETKEVWCDLLPNDAEITPTPVIDYEVTDDAVIVTATGEGHVCLYIEDILCAEGEDFAQYVISRTEYDQEYNVSATAQADGMEVSEYALATVYVPAIQIAEKLDVPAPVIETSMDDDNVYVTIIWPETDGDQVYTGEYTYSRTYENQTYEVEAYTTETEIYKESEHAYATILVPAKESPSTGDIVFVAGIDNGTSDGTAGAFSIEKEGVKIEVSRGLANASHYRIYHNQTLKITSTVGAITKVTFDCVAPGDAQYGPGCFSAEPGDYTYYDYVGTWSGESESITFTAVTTQVRATRISVTLSQSGQITPMPEITTSMTDNSVVVTATGEGEVKLYINGVAVSNPYAINRGTEDKTYTATATAQADGMTISETARATIEVPKMEGDGSFLYINDYQIPTSKLGGEIVLPLRAHFDARVSGWLVEMTFPEGITPVYCEAGGAITVTYLDSRGTQQTTKASFTPGPTNTNILSYFGTAGFWMPEGATEYESYGVVKWEAGDYGEMALIYCEVDPDFTGGQLIVNSDPSSGNDTRGGTTAPGQHHSYITNLTIGGQELEGEVLIGDCDANGKVPVSYNGPENVTLDVMIDGQLVPVIDGMVQLKHYGRSIVSAEVTAIGYAPLHVNAEVNWVAINNGDWEILKAFYNQYKNDVLVWDMSDRNKPGSCPGVSSENGRVTAITLPDHELEGGFPTMLLGLDKLTVLDLSYNNLSGDASADMTQYAAANGIKARGLKQLYIHHNDFIGNVGALAALFSNLETLNVSNNHFAQVDPMVNPAIDLNLSNQLLEMDGDITGGIEVLGTSLPTICLYDHTGQSFEADVLEVALANNNQSPRWNMTMYFYDGGYWLEDISSEPYRGANGETIDGHTALSCDYWDNVQQLLINFIFNPGDANLNGPVDITDLQAIVNYIFGDYGRRFNFTAANLNNDAIINVQDVVGEANLLLSMELTMPTLRRAPSTDVDLTEACLYWNNDTLYLSTTVPIAALDIVNNAEGDITWNVANLGFVVKNATSAQGAHAVIYSLGDAVIEPGVTAIATTNGRMPSVVAAKLSNADAELVEVRLNDRMTGLKNLTEDGKPQCHINGTNLVITNGTDLNDVDIDIYTVDGKLVWGKHVNRLENGNTSFDLSDISGSHRYYIIVVRNGRQIIATQKLTQIR